MNDADRVKSAQALKQLREDWPAVLARYELFAEMHKAKYDALIKAKFDQAQALELCKVIF